MELSKSEVGSAEFVHEFGQPGNFAAGRRFVNDPFAGGFIDKRHGPVERFLCGLAVFFAGGFAHLLDQIAHGRANVAVAGSAFFRLTNSLQSRFVIGQSFYPPCCSKIVLELMKRSFNIKHSSASS